MLIGCCTTIDRYDALRELGYQAIALAGRDVAAMDDQTFSQAAEAIKAGPLVMTSLNAFCPPSLHLNGPDADLRAVRDYTRRLCARAQAMGVQSIGVGSPASRSVPEGYPPEQAIAEFGRSLAEICEIAADDRMEVLLEPLARLECNCVNTTLEALELIHQLKLPNLHLLYDIYHACLMGEPLEWLELAAPEIRCAHISGAEGGEHTYLSPRCMKPLRPYVQALARSGYQGQLLLEAFSGDPERGPRQSLELLRAYMDAPQGQARGI